MIKILQIAILFLLTFGPSRVSGTERYPARDTTAVNLLIDWADSLRYQAIDLDKAHIVFLEVLTLSKQLNHHRESEIRRKLAYNLASRDKLDSALLAYNELFDFCLNHKDYEGLAEAYNSAGTAFSNKGRYPEAESFIIEAIDIADKHKLYINQCKYLRILSEHYDAIGKRLESIETAEKTLALAKRIKNPKEIALANMQLGNVFMTSGEYNRAKNFFTVYQNYSIEYRDTLFLARSNVNLGNVYYHEDKRDSALFHYLAAIKLFDYLGKKSYTTSARYNAASIYYLLDSIPQFLKYLDEADNLFKSSSNFGGMLDVMYARAEYLRNQKKYREAVNLSKEAIQLCLKTENLQLRLEFYDGLAISYQHLDILDSALLFNKAYIALHDSIYTNDLQAGLISADMVQRHNVAELEERIRLLDLLNKRRLYIMWGLGLLALLILIIAVIGIKSLQHKRNLAETRLKLHEQKIEKLLSDQELKSINAMMEGQDKERKRIAQDLHDRLGSMLSTVKHHFSAMETKITELRDQNMEQYNTAITLLDDAVREVRHISHDMLSGTLVKFGLSAALQDLKNSIEVPGKLTVELNLFGLDHRLDNEVEIAVYRIIQELVGNSLKHANASEMTIQLTLSDDNLNVMVEDNGRGFDTKNLTSDGIGLKNIYDRIKRLNGTYHLDAAVGRGTTFVIDIPVNTNA
jgi:two-component system, NarL family, sensor kinase